MVIAAGVVVCLWMAAFVYAFVVWVAAFVYAFVVWVADSVKSPTQAAGKSKSCSEASKATSSGASRSPAAASSRHL